MLRQTTISPSNPPVPDNSSQTRRTFFAAMASFGAACLFAGGAGCLVLGAPVPPNTVTAALSCSLTAAAVALVGIGLILSARDKLMHNKEFKRTTRAESIQRELDGLSLTPKEMAVAKLILQHRSYEDIAQICAMAPRTVQFHATNVFRKAYVTRRRDFERLLLSDVDETSRYERIPRLMVEEPENSAAQSDRAFPEPQNIIVVKRQALSPCVTRSRVALHHSHEPQRT